MFQNRYKKWNKEVWIAKKIGEVEDDYGYKIPIYARPLKYKMNVQPIKSSADIQQFGEHSKGMQKAVIELKKYLNEFSEFDIAYLDGKNPLEDGGQIVINVNELSEAKVSEIDNLKVSNLGTIEAQCYTCPNANYRLHPPRNQNKCITIYFERLAGR